MYLAHLGSSIFGGSWGSVPQQKLFRNGPESDQMRRILCLFSLTILLAKICKNIEKSLEKCIFCIFTKFHFKGVLGGGVRARMALRWLKM